MVSTKENPGRSIEQHIWDWAEAAKIFTDFSAPDTGYTERTQF